MTRPASILTASELTHGLLAASTAALPCGPLMRCARLPAFDRQDWDAVAAAFATADFCRLGQAWLPTPDPRLRDTLVATGWTETDLVVYAILHDDDAFNPVTEFNSPFFLQGDAFEIFLRPQPQATYFELHVGPANQQFQLRVPSAALFAQARQQPELGDAWKIPQPFFESTVRLQPHRQMWNALVFIPFAAVMEPDAARPASSETTSRRPVSDWLVSFSRYDYTRNCPQPVLSSTSPHRVAGFHQQHEWSRLVFESR